MEETLQSKNEEFGLHLMEPQHVDAVQMLIEDHNHLRSNFDTYNRINLTDLACKQKLRIFFQAVRSFCL